MSAYQDFPILRRGDGSYVITLDGLPYRVPPEGEFLDLWEEIDTYVRAHPDRVTDDPPPPVLPEPAPEKAAALRAEIIKARLKRLDFESIRPLRAILDGTATDEDSEKLSGLEAEVWLLREELQELEAQAGE